MVHRLGDLNLPERLAPTVPIWLTQLVIAVLALGLAAVSRVLINLVADGGVPFLMVFPPILIASMLGGRLSGALCLAIGAVAAWVFAFPPVGQFAGKPEMAPINTAIFLVSGVLTVLIAGFFRDSARQQISDHAHRLSDRELLLREFQHRVKNDFQIIGSVLALQRKKAVELGAEGLIDEAVSRLRGLSEVHANLWSPADGDAGEVNLEQYLNRLCAALSASFSPGAAISLVCKADPCIMPRDRAGAIGLIVNELVTNALKHAFPEGVGHILVEFHAEPGGGRLTVSDDGVGLPPDFDRAAGVGRKLIAAFAKQADGDLTWVNQRGARFQLDLAAP